MLDKTKLRGADFITSIGLMLFGVWILFQTFKMPMKDTYGGVINVWYVSPALFPLFIGTGIILLAINILIHAIKNGGFQAFKESLQSKKGIHLTEKGYRFLAILVPLLSLVYMNLPRIDFFLSILLFLLFFITVFYFDDFLLLKKLLGFYSIEMGILLLLFLTGMDTILTKAFRYSLDILALGLITALYIFLRIQIRGQNEYTRKLRNAFMISLLTPLILVPTFRFFLRVPLPKEGGIVDLLFILYYAFR
ncbi:MAG: hypothetical protein N2442_04300 [Spirochaetes bacterium]|nr:hypothetical protein [Spirochaetota bacterium]